MWECDSGCPDCVGSSICIGDGSCDSALGETCANAPGDCPCTSGICCPSDPSSNPIGCSGVTSLSEGDECYCDSQCSAGLTCNPTAATFTAYANACAPPGSRWDGTTSVVYDAFNIIFVALHYDVSQTASFRAAADQALATFIAETPLNTCPDPENRVQAYYVDPADCTQTAGCEAGIDICGGCQNIAIDCAIDTHGNIWDKVIGLVNHQFMYGTGEIIGCSGGIPAESSVTSTLSPYYTPVTVTHETGHAMGLCHVWGLARPASGCPNDDSCSGYAETSACECIMGYGSMQYFCPDAYNYLETDTINGLADYLGGCS